MSRTEINITDGNVESLNISIDITEHRITQSILEFSNDPELVYQALLHWRWSQFERKRRSLLRSKFKNIDLTTTEEYSILVFIQLNPKTFLGEISEYLSMEKSTISEFIKRCIKKEWITETSMESDRRKYSYTLTPKGNESLAAAHIQMSELNSELFNKLNSDESQQLLELLIKVLQK